MQETDALRKVRALLAKAESTDSAAEAESLTNTATAIMAKYGLDAALVSARAETREVPTSIKVNVSNPYAAQKSALYNVIAKANRCRLIKISSGASTVLHVFGFQTDLEIVELLYTSLLLQSANQMRNIQASRYESARARRGSFLLGFAAEIGDRLKAANARAKAGMQDSPGTDLVLASREVQISDAFRAKYPRTRGVATRAGSNAAYGAGRDAGARANLHNRSNVGGAGYTALGA